MTTSGSSDPREAAPSAGRVAAVVQDLFFVARIGEVARQLGVPIVFAKTADALASAVTSGVKLVIVDLTGRIDHAAVFAALADVGVPVLGFTTHALARQTQPWHDRCDRVVTKETLTQELPSFLTIGIASREAAS